jgi:hypothetical protein
MAEPWEIESVKPVTAEIDAASLSAIKEAIHPANRFMESDGGFILFAFDLTTGKSQRVVLKIKK